MTADRKALRTTSRILRAEVPPARRRLAARRVAARARESGLLRHGAFVGLYVSMPTEFDTQALLSAAFASGCSVFLPRIHDWKARRMQFRRHAPGGQLLRNRYGILEPDRRTARPIAARRLDVVFVPLVAVDPHGTRLGMGAGFYDRHFAYRRRLRTWRRPRLIGVAYDFQRVTYIEREPWDVALDAVITESGLYRTRTAGNGGWRSRR